MNILKFFVFFVVATANAQSGIEVLKTYTEASYSVIAVSPNQQYLAGKVGREGDIEIRDLDDFVFQTALIDENSLGYDYVEFSPDGRFLALGQQYDVRVWSTVTWEMVAIFETSHRWGAPFSFTPDSEFIFVGNGATVEKWTLPGGTLLSTWDALGSLYCLTVSPDGARLATGTGFNGNNVAARVWRIESEEQLMSVQPSLTYRVASFAYSSDGSFFATAGEFRDDSIEVWNALDGSKVSASYSPSQATHLAFSGNNEILFSSLGKWITLWDWKTGRRLTAIPGISKVVPGPTADEFYYLTEEGHVTLARLPIWLRQPSITDGQIAFKWLGREGTFQLQRTGSINEDWENVGVPVSERETTVPAEGASGFYRLVEIETTGTNP